MNAIDPRIHQALDGEVAREALPADARRAVERLERAAGLLAVAVPVERLEARVTVDQKRLIARAANLRGTSVTDFVVVSAQQAARETIKDYEMLSLRDEAREVFVNAILNPPAPNEAARIAVARYKEHPGL